MGRKTIAALLLAGALGGFAAYRVVPEAAAQAVTPPGPVVQGEVTGKYKDAIDQYYAISVNDGPAIEVSPYFYNQVEVGDLVRFDGTNWVIIKTRLSRSGVNA